MTRIAILGSGAWGTALAISLANRGGHDVSLWSRSAEVAAQIQDRRENRTYLPGFAVPMQIAVTTDAASAIRDAGIVVSAIPSQYLRAGFTNFAEALNPDQIIVSATKGIEDTSLMRMSEVIAEICTARGLQLPCGVLSGPSFAQEVAAGSPTALTIAFADARIGSRVQQKFGSSSLRLYTNHDVIGVELGGALKNVIAISSGIVTGLGLGHNSAAALITRGIAEITRLAVACGGHRKTLAGLSGLGDLVLTCTGSLSRNRLVGIELGKGRKLSDILEDLHGKVAEGVRTTFAALGLAHQHGIEMPITEQMAAILREGKAPMDAMRELMARPGRDE